MEKGDPWGTPSPLSGSRAAGSSEWDDSYEVIYEDDDFPRPVAEQDETFDSRAEGCFATNGSFIDFENPESSEDEADINMQLTMPM